MNHQSEQCEFEKKAGIVFKNRDLLDVAFTHRSFVNESNLASEHNERLEFLGDAVLELVVTDALFKNHPDAPEGVLTSYRSALVNTSMLGSVAEDLGINTCLRLSKGEAKDTGRARATILANALEAAIGALYIDQGYAVAEKFIKTHIVSRTDDVIRTGAWKDSKSAFQELAQAKYGHTPKYEVLSSDGPDHDKHFVVSVTVDGRSVATGEGSSKQEAEQNAAGRALANES